MRKYALTVTLLLLILPCFGQFHDNNSVPYNPFGHPLIPDMAGDPSIIVHDGTFYCYVTTDGYGQGLETSGPSVVWKSRDFVNWSFEGTYFPQAVWGERNFARLGEDMVTLSDRTHIKIHTTMYTEGPILFKRKYFVPGFAADASNGSRWMADSTDKAPVLTVDFGAVRRVGTSRIAFVRPGSHTYSSASPAS